MSWPVFLLRLVGRSEEQVEAERSFEESLSKTQEAEEALDDLLLEIRDVDAVVRAKGEVLEQAVSNAPPPSEEEDTSHSGDKKDGRELHIGRVETTPSKA